MIWRDERDEIAAFNMVHRSGVEGWMGPLAVRPDYQGSGLGKEIVRAGVEWLKQARRQRDRARDDAAHDGQHRLLLRARLRAGHLTITVTLDAARAGIQATAMSALNPHERELALRQCRHLLEQLAPGYDYTREIVLTAQHQLGDTLFVRKGERDAVVRALPLGAAGRRARDGGDARAQDGRAGPRRISISS